MPTHAAVLAPLEADQHLDNPRDLVLRPRGVGECQVTVHAEDVDGCGALHRGPLRHREEVAAVALRPASAAFGPRRNDGETASSEASRWLLAVTMFVAAVARSS